jgi:hypothetical protein
MIRTASIAAALVIALVIAVAQSPARAASYSEGCTATNSDGVCTSYQTSTTLTSSEHACLLCTPISKITSLGDSFSRKVFDNMAGHAKDLLSILGQIWFVLLCFQLILNPDEKRQALSKVAKEGALIIILATVFGTGSTGVAFEWMFDLLQLQAVNVGNSVLDTAKEIGALTTGSGSSSSAMSTVGSTVWSGSSGSSGGFSSTSTTSSTVSTAYVTMWMQMEDTIYPLFSAFMDQMKAADTGSLKTILYFLIWLFVLVPYIFVAVIFGAFLLQASFYFIVVISVSPMLMLGLIFEKTRGFFFNGVRLCLSGGLTIVFAAVALGMTSTVISDGIKDFNKTAGQDAFYGQPYYVELVLMGWVSVALHLLAPRLASNVSGAQDSATGAAAAAAFTQWVVGKSLYGAFRAARGGVGMLAGLAGRGGAAVGQNLSDRFRKARNDGE